MIKKSGFYLLSFVRYWKFTENCCTKKWSKYTLPMTLVTLISPEGLIRLSWNFGFLPNIIWSTYCKNISQIGDGHWATLGVAYMQCLLGMFISRSLNEFYDFIKSPSVIQYWKILNVKTSFFDKKLLISEIWIWQAWIDVMW